jgi:hypothetical protein
MTNPVILKRSSVAGKIPVVGDLSLGELAFNTYDGKLYGKKNNGADFIVPIGARPRAVTIENPTNAEKIPLFKLDFADVISAIRAVIIGSGSPSITFSLRYGTDLSAAGTEVITGGTAVTNTTSGASITTFNSAAIPANNYLWLTTTAKAGTVNWLNLTIEF